ncbi:MAG: MBL fold metallo-hydrolase [Phycisphaerae bacterium]
MKTGKDLIADIDSTKLGRSGLALWWLGQHSFIIKAPAGVIYLDPFLTDMPGRLVPPLLAPGDVTNAAIIAGTHDHGDHIDRPAWPVMAKVSPAARFILPDPLKAQLAKDLRIPVRRFIGMDDGWTVENIEYRTGNIEYRTRRPGSDTSSFDISCSIFDNSSNPLNPRNPDSPSPAQGGVRITAVASAHEFLDRDEATGRYPYLGYIIKANGRTIYHAGDCCIYEGLVTKLRRWRFDAMILPINGRDATRLAANCIGNMTYQEAADLAGAVGTKLVIPAHYDMFKMNLGSPSDFAAYVSVKYPKMKVRICEHGERFTI